MNLALTNCGLKYITEHLNSLIDLQLSPEDKELNQEPRSKLLP